MTEKNWGVCDLDCTACFGAGAICKSGPHRKFDVSHKGQGKKEPFRNRDCSHFKKDHNTLSEWEKHVKV